MKQFLTITVLAASLFLALVVFGERDGVLSTYYSQAIDYLAATFFMPSITVEEL